MTMPEHTNPFDVLFIGIRGTASMVSGSNQWQISEGETIFVSSDEMRGWVNDQSEPCRVMVIKVFK